MSVQSAGIVPSSSIVCEMDAKHCSVVAKTLQSASQANNRIPVSLTNQSNLTRPNAALVEQVLDVAEREREPDVERDHQADDLGRCLEVLERVGLVIAGR